ncbi:hypothetical protein NIB75_16165 [Bacteroides uniformis]|nr:hypothetical protein [Bacteroides uniformis]
MPKGYLELLEQKRYSPSTIKTYRAYFSDFMEYHKGRNIDRPESRRHQQIHTLSCEREEKSRCRNRICASMLSSSIMSK